MRRAGAFGGELKPALVQVVMSELLRLLQVEDSERDAAFVVRILEKAGYLVQSQRVEDAEAMRAALEKRTWDAIIADYRLPRFDAPAALVILHQSGLDLPFIVVSGKIGEELAVALMKAGAHDYLMKDRLNRLAPVVEREIGEARTRLEGKQTETALDKSEQQNRSQRVTMDEQAQSLAEKEALLREIHHRVKNNLQVVSSLLGLQSRTAANPETSKTLQESQNRIHSMALLHESLYQSDSLAEVDFPGYITQLTEYLFQSYGRRDQVQLQTDMDSVRLNIDMAVPCGLIINEVLSNSLKHAFPEGREGEVRIALREEPPGTAQLVLADNGIGLRQDVDWTTSRTLGLRLVRTLAQQLHGELEVESGAGTEVRLRFPLEPPNPN